MAWAKIDLVMKRMKPFILLLPVLSCFLFFPILCQAQETPTLTPAPEATTEASLEAEITLSPVVDLEISLEATLETTLDASSSATPTSEPTPTEVVPTPTPTETKPRLILGSFSPGELVIVCLIVVFHLLEDVL